MESGNNELIIDVQSSEISIALLENKKLVELSREKSNIQFSVGDIYLGRVRQVMSGLNACFVDVGYTKDAFLHYFDLGHQFKSLTHYLNSTYQKGKSSHLSKYSLLEDIPKDGKISEIVKSGQPVIVQIAKEPISTKGPRLSSEISIAGRNMVIVPFSDKVSISHKIESSEEKQRLKKLIQSIRPKNYGVIIRTAAEGKKVAELDSELRQLVKRWECAFDSLKGKMPPHLAVGEINRTIAIIRDHLNVNFSSIIVNDETVYNEIKDYISEIAKDKQKIVKHYSGKLPVFEHYGIEKQIKSSFGKTATFGKGAYLVIEHTEALHVIDVNSGNRSNAKNNQEENAVAVNLAAADEIARQLRLRDMGGIIVVDFIDMHKGENKAKLFEHMKQAMSRDNTKHSILPLSKFGLMQITRQRVRPEMNIKTAEKCPVCKGTGQIAPSIILTDEIENTLAIKIREKELNRVELKAHPFVAAYLTKGFKSVRKQWQKKYKCKIKVVGMDALNYMEFKMSDKDGNEI